MPREIREIITKAVVGKGQLKNKTVYLLDEVNEVSSILGCWIVNHHYEAKMENQKLFVHGAFDLNIWYSLKNEQKSQVYVKTIQYQDELPIRTKESIRFDNEMMLITSCPQAPVCLEAQINEQGIIEVSVEKALHVDLVGETKICIEVCEAAEDWDEIDMAINPSFLEK